MRWKWIFLIIGLITLTESVSLSAQVSCTGSFGENIFREGDFGSGNENIVSNVVGIAPGYIYTTQTPPQDGYFTITNDMGRWFDNYGTWISIGDHSDDPRGYMMVVNASYSPGIFYEQTIDSLCPNTTFEFSADIINIVNRSSSDHILPDLDFLINDSIWYSTGPIPQDEQWHKHGFIFTLDTGQTSLKLTLINKAPGGIGNDLAIDNITFRPCGPEPDINLVTEYYFCEDGALPATITTQIDTNQYFIQWQTIRAPGLDWIDTGARNMTGITQDLSTPGTYYYRYKVSSSEANLDYPYCVSLSQVVSSVVLPLQYEVWDTICTGNTRNFEGRRLADPGNYTASFTSSRGCDSIVTLHLEVVDRNPPFYDLETGDPNCHDSSDGFIEITNTSVGYPPYEFILDGDTIRTGRFEGLTSGTLEVEIVDHFGCIYPESVELVNPPRFDLTSIPDTQLVLGQDLTIHISATQPVSSVTAQPDILQDCRDCSRVVFIPTGSSVIVIEALNGNGCTSTDSFFVEVNDEDLPIAFPNGFSPNGDGFNDEFRIITPPHLVSRIISIAIFDRWGNLVNNHPVLADSPSGTVLWDGYTGGRPIEPGVFAYSTELELINGEVRLFKGEVTLVR